MIPTGFLVTRGTRDPHPLAQPFAYRTVTSFGPAFQRVRLGLTRFL